MRAKNYEEKVATLLEVKHYIDESLDDLINGRRDDINGKDIAAHFGYPYMTFRQFVQDVGGFTLHNYIRTRKVQKAAELLRNGVSTTKAARSVGYDTLAAGDSFNDIAMLRASRAGFLFRTSEAVRQANPDLPAFEDYGPLLEAISAAL